MVKNVHYNDVIMSVMASQITRLTSVYWSVYSGADQRKHQSSASLAFVRGIHRWPVNSPHKGPVTRKMLPFDDVIMTWWCLLGATSLPKPMKTYCRLDHYGYVWWVLPGYMGTSFSTIITIKPWIDSSLPGQNGRHFADDIFKCISLNEKAWISIKIPVKFVPKGPINNNPALVQIMAWRRPGDKPLSEPMLTQFIDAYKWHQGEMSWLIIPWCRIYASVSVCCCSWWVWSLILSLQVTTLAPGQSRGYTCAIKATLRNMQI